MNQFATMRTMSQIAEQIGMDYPEVPNSRYAAQTVNNFIFAWEEERSVKNPITTEEDEGFSEPRTPVSEPPRQPTATEARPALRSIENLQNTSAARNLFDLLKKHLLLLVFCIFIFCI